MNNNQWPSLYTTLPVNDDDCATALMIMMMGHHRTDESFTSTTTVSHQSVTVIGVVAWYPNKITKNNKSTKGFVLCRRGLSGAIYTNNRRGRIIGRTTESSIHNHHCNSMLLIVLNTDKALFPLHIGHSLIFQDASVRSFSPLASSLSFGSLIPPLLIIRFLSHHISSSS